MKSRLDSVLLAATFLALLPSVAKADVGTPLLLATGFYLFLGNALIGVVEGLLLAWIFRRPAAMCVMVMILANYCSAWGGGFFFLTAAQPPDNLDLYSVRDWLGKLYGLVALSYAATLLIEWPFVAFCFRKTEHWFRKSLYASLIVQTASYVVIILAAWFFSQTELLTDVTIVPPSQANVPRGLRLYFVSPSSRDVCRLDFDTKEETTLCRLPGDSWPDLYVAQSKADANRVDLLAMSGGDDSTPFLLREFARDGPPPRAKRPMRGQPQEGARSNKEPDEFVPPDIKTDWEFYRSRYHSPWGALEGNNVKDGRQIWLILEIPPLTWSAHLIATLPDGHVLFQLGENQICVLDPEKRTVALLAKGRGAVATMKVRAD
jgi:hypothetical protein